MYAVSQAHKHRRHSAPPHEGWGGGSRPAGSSGSWPLRAALPLSHAPGPRGLPRDQPGPNPAPPERKRARWGGGGHTSMHVDACVRSPCSPQVTCHGAGAWPLPEAGESCLALFGLAQAVCGNAWPVNMEQMTQDSGTCRGTGSCLACQGLGYLQPGSAVGSKGVSLAVLHPAAGQQGVQPGPQPPTVPVSLRGSV